MGARHSSVACTDSNPDVAPVCRLFTQVPPEAAMPQEDLLLSPIRLYLQHGHLGLELVPADELVTIA